MNIKRMQKLTRDLIAIDSVTGNEGEIYKFITDVLASHGMNVQIFPVDKDRCNILASWDNKPVRILFNTHLDTVPPQYGPYEDDERIYGRGACDTHGILAAQIETLSELQQQGIDGLGMLLVVGEECDHDGAKHVGKSQEITQPDVLIVGEPTENRLIRRQKGRLKADLFVHGLEGHSGYPEKYDSAVEKLFLFLDAIRESHWLKKDSREGTTMNVIIPEAGHIDNKVPGFAHARLMFRCSEPCTTIKYDVDEILYNLQKSFTPSLTSKPHFEIKWDDAESDPISLNTLPGFETALAAFNTDISYFGWKNCKRFLVGPGSIFQAHKDLQEDDWMGGEWILKEEQIRGVQIYKDLVLALVKDINAL